MASLPFDDALRAPSPQRFLQGRIRRIHFQSDPMRGEGGGEAGVHKGHELVHAVGFGRQWIEADPAFAVAVLHPPSDRHGFRENRALFADECRGLMARVYPRIGRQPHFAKHVHAAQTIGLAQPLQRSDEPHGTSQRKAIDKNGFQDFFLRR